MFIGVARFDLVLLDQPQNLKEKRSIVRRLRDEIRNKLQLSVAEVDAQDLWQRAVFGVASVSGDQATARKLLQDCADLIAAHPELEIVHEEIDVDSY